MQQLAMCQLFAPMLVVRCAVSDRVPGHMSNKADDKSKGIYRRIVGRDAGYDKSKSEHHNDHPEDRT